MTEKMKLPRSLPKAKFNAVWIDIDGDGWEDLVLCNRVYRNENGKRFVDYTDECNLNTKGSVTGLVADYDRDGKMDLYLTFAGPPSGQLLAIGEERRRHLQSPLPQPWQLEI